MVLVSGNLRCKGYLHRPLTGACPAYKKTLGIKKNNATILNDFFVLLPYRYVCDAAMMVTTAELSSLTH